MALLDAYASAAEYRARTGNKTTGTDTTLDAELLGSTRLAERSLGVSAGGFNPVSSATYTFDAQGGSQLWLRDREGRAYFLRSITADSVGIDSEGDGTFDGYTLDLNDAWLRGLPENAAALSEPYTSLELLAIASATVTKWPDRPAAVRITGDWGWAAVPEIVKNLVIHLTQDLRHAMLAGSAGSIPAIDEGLPLSADTWRFWRLAESMYSRRIPAIA